MIRRRCVGWQFEGGEDLGQEQPGSEIAAQQVGVLALPADPGAGGQRFFHHRRGIDEDLDAAAVVVGDPAAQLLALFLQHVVIVAALGIDADGAAVGTGQHRQGVFAGAVVGAEHDDGLGLGHQGLGVAAPAIVIVQPRHVALAPVGEE